MVQWLAVLLVTALLTACGGGGGSPGQVGGGTGGGSTTPAPVASIAPLRLVYADGSEVTTRQLSQSVDMFLQTRVLNAAGSPIPFERVTFAVSDPSLVVSVPANGAVLTDNLTGIARIKVTPANVLADGAISATAQATIGGVSLSSDLNFNISPGVVELRNLLATPGTVQRGQAVVASVDVLVNGARASSNSVAVNFVSNCGTVSPSPALVDASGRAVAVVQTTAVGTCQVSAAFNTVTIPPVSYTVTAPPITALEFVSASPERIYQTGSTGVTTSIVKFKVVDSVGGGVPSVSVSASLTNADGGVNFCGSPSTAQSSQEGEVSFSVCSGTLPTTVQVRASLVASPTVYADSNRLTIQTGLPTQRFFDISASQLNIWAGGYFTNRFNGNETEITVFAADRQGNPVPQGTSVVFVAEGGQLVTSGASSCQIGANGRCSVRLVGQDYRPLGSNVAGADPRPGRVTVLAYTDGEESFIDANNNNRYDAGELFEDLGLPFLDKDEDGLLTRSYRNLVMNTEEGENSYPLPIGASGTTACPESPNGRLSVANTCNGRWDGATKVRRSILVIFSGDEIGQPGLYHTSIPVDRRTEVLGRSRGAISVRLADLNGNPLPSMATVSTEVLNGTDCKATLVGGSTIGSTTEPTSHFVSLKDCLGGESVLVKATVAGKESFLSVTVP